MVIRIRPQAFLRLLILALPHSLVSTYYLSSTAKLFAQSKLVFLPPIYWFSVVCLLIKDKS